MNRPEPPPTPRLTPSAWVRCVDTRPESGEGCMLADGHSGAHESATRAWHNRALEPPPVVVTSIEDIDRIFREPLAPFFDWGRPVRSAPETAEPREAVRPLRGRPRVERGTGGSADRTTGGERP